MTIQLDDVTVSTTMRTPGHDFELAVGFCHSEGLLADAPVTEIRYCGTGSAVQTEFNVVSVSTGGIAPPPSPRLGSTSSSCGWCGSDQIDNLVARLDPLPDTKPMTPELLGGIADAVRPRQKLFAATGAVHAAATFDTDGSIGIVREDVGRHNAVDKIIGRLRLDGELPQTGRGLFVSGRASIEMVQKAWSAGFSTMVAVSAPTALAVDAARRANLTLAGFITPARLNIYQP